jgi:hypothetical protein
MKNVIQFAVVAFVFMCSGIAVQASNSLNTGNPPIGWELLGTKSVDYLIDRDEIAVTAREGFFTALKLKVTRSALNVHKMTVHFGDDTTQDVDLKKNFKAGEESRVIDLKGNKRVITKVVFWYDTKNSKNSKAIVELWGKH